MKPASRPIVDQPLPLPQRWGGAEKARLEAMLSQSSLFYWRGAQTDALRKEFRRHYPFDHVVPVSSGSAAVHVAIASLSLRPGDEVIVPAITDMGSVIGILYQQGVPVFADLDPQTSNLDPADVERKVTARTRAVLAVHLAGNPADMQRLRELAGRRNLVLIEDCAQAWGARWQGNPVGLAGDLACYSFNDFKHLSCGDGGIVATNNTRLGPTLYRWGDKYYDRTTGGRDPDELAPNYRMSEPQAAVAAGQLTKLESIVAARVRVGSRLTAALRDVPGLRLPAVRDGDTHSYWFYLIRVERRRFPEGRDHFAAALAAEGVVCTAGYIRQPVYRYPVFQSHGFFGGRWPLRDFDLTSMDYRTVYCPEAESFVGDCVRIVINEAMDDAYVGRVALAIRSVVERHVY